MGEGTQILNESVEQSVEIYAIDGRLLKSQISNFETVDVSKLNAGIYILKVNMADGKEFTERIVK